MITGVALAHASVLLVSALVNAGVMLYAYRHQEVPGATAFVALMASIVWWAVAYGIGLVTLDPEMRILWHKIQWFATASTPTFLLLFALAYTGYDEFLNRRTVGLLFVPPLFFIAAVWTNHWFGLIWPETGVKTVDGLALMNESLGPVFWMDVIWNYGLIAIAIALLLRLIYQSDYLYTDQSALLLVGIAAPFVLNAIDIFWALPNPGVDYTPHGLLVTGLAFGYALFRRQLFDLVPATRQLGRNTAISQLDAGVIILDNNRRIVYCNEAAGEVLESPPAETLGQEARSFVDESRIAFDAEDALAEIEREDGVYEIRTSTITDRNGERIGHTLVFHDVTVRKRREQELANQRDELQTVNELNATIRGVNQALLSASGREEIERAVCERLADGALYETVCVGDVATWSGDASRWLVAGSEDQSAPALDDAALADEDGPDRPISPADATQGGTWKIVPMCHGRTVYGAIGLYTDRETVSDRERTVLSELGEMVGHAINATETRQLLAAETVVELELATSDASVPLLAAAERVGGRLTLAGLVPGGDQHVAYVRVADGDTAAARDALAATDAGEVRTIRDGEDGLLEWQVTGDALLGVLADHGGNVTHTTADGEAASYELEIASESSARSLVDRAQHQFGTVEVVSKREHTRPDRQARALRGDSLEDLTDRQQEALEAAYRAGYFSWPRDSTAEEVAETLDIAAPTLHSHLRKAEESLLADLFDATSRREPGD